MAFDNAYESLIEDNDARWAFGSDFTDPLAGVDTTVPDGVDGAALATYCLMLGDDALVLSHRLQEWVARSPELEDDVAVANVALDLLGQARLLLARAGKADGTDRDEDAFAFLRPDTEFSNVRLVEAPDVDFAFAMARLLVFSTWRLALLQGLVGSRDPVLAAIAEKGVKEVAYHRDYAAGWVVRLGDGTDESRRRMVAALGGIWPLVEELFAASEVERAMAEQGIGVDPATLRPQFDEVLTTVLGAATLAVPDAAPFGAVAGRRGREGVHTEHLGYLLAEMQSVARAYPGATW